MSACLAARVEPQLAREGRRLRVERGDHHKRDGDLFARAGGELQALQPGAVLGGQQAVALGEAMVVEHGLDPLLPLAALIDQRVPQADLRAQIQQVIRRNPRLGQPSDHQQLAQVPRVGAVGLGALLVPAPRRGLGRLSKISRRADRVQLFDHEPPARRRLQRHLQPLAGEALEELPDVTAVRGRNAGTADLTGVGVDPLGRDLSTVLIESHYDRHHGASSSSTVDHLRASCALELRRSQLRRDHHPAHAIFARERGPGADGGRQPARRLQLPLRRDGVCLGVRGRRRLVRSGGVRRSEQTVLWRDVCDGAHGLPEHRRMELAVSLAKRT
jgi:hypothetical protein